MQSGDDRNGDAGSLQMRRTRPPSAADDVVYVVDDEKPADDATPRADAAATCSDPPSDTVCSICLGALQNKSFTDSCFHMFCFVCLLEWSRVKAVCPLCKQPFSSIIHSVRSLEDYDRHYVEAGAAGAGEEGGETDARFRYRTTLTADRWLRHLQREHDRQLQLLQQSTEVESGEGVSVRQRVYERGERAFRVSSARVRDVSPAFLSAHPACIHRLAPWLRRELAALLAPSPADRRRFVLELVLELVTHFAIDSDDFAEHVRPFVGRRTSHFVYEFRSFATAPYDMASYDRRVRYPSDADAQPAHTVSSDAGDSSDGSDVVVVSLPTNTSMEVILSGSSPPLPAPIILSPGFSPPASPPVSPPLEVLASPPPFVVIKTEAYSSPGSDVEVTGYEKPWEQRSPNYVCLSSPTAIERRDEKRQTKRRAAAIAAMASTQISSSSDSDDSHRHRSHKHHRRRRSASTDADEVARRRRRERRRHEEPAPRRRRQEPPQRPARHDQHRSSRRGIELDDRAAASRHRRYDDRSSQRGNDREDRAASSASSRRDVDREEREEASRRRLAEREQRRQRHEELATARREQAESSRQECEAEGDAQPGVATSTATAASTNPWSLGSLLARKNELAKEDADADDSHKQQRSADDSHKQQRSADDSCKQQRSADDSHKQQRSADDSRKQQRSADDSRKQRSTDDSRKQRSTDDSRKQRSTDDSRKHRSTDDSHNQQRSGSTESTRDRHADREAHCKKNSSGHKRSRESRRD